MQATAPVLSKAELFKTTGETKERLERIQERLRKMREAQERSDFFSRKTNTVVQSACG